VTVRVREPARPVSCTSLDHRSVAYCDAHVVGAWLADRGDAASARKGETRSLSPISKPLPPRPTSRSSREPVQRWARLPLCQPEERGVPAGRHRHIPCYVGAEITHSAAFKQDGLLVVTFDEAGADSTACCSEKPGPQHPSPASTDRGVGDRCGPDLAVHQARRIVFPHRVQPLLTLGLDRGLFGLPRLGDARKVPTIFGPPVFTRRRADRRWSIPDGASS